MRALAAKLLGLLDRRDRWKAGLLVGLMLASALVQTLGVAAVMPFLSVVANPEVIQTNERLQTVYQWFEFEDENRFLLLLGVLAFIVFISGTFLQAATQWAITRFSHMRQYWLSRRLMVDYLRRPYSFFLNRNASDLAKTVLTETTQVINGALLPAFRLLSHGVLAAALILLLIAIQPKLALIVAASLGSVYGAIYLISNRWLDRMGMQRLQSNRKRFSAVSEAFAGAKEIRLLGRERAYLERFQTPAKHFARTQANAQILGQTPQYAIEGLAFGGVLALVLVLMAGEGGLQEALPLISVYALAAKKLIPAFQTIFAAFAALRFAMPAVDNLLQDLGDHPGSSPLPGARSLPSALAPEREIRLEEISYRYPEAKELALKNLSLTIPARTTVGLVGSSGAGKSTLVDLMLGLLEPESGRIMIDGQPLGKENFRQWQAAIGYVPQHIFLSDESIAANIALGIPKDEVDNNAVENAAQLANLHEFILNELPAGYDTEIGDNGVRLSGGQRQRIGIARALYRDPPVIVFDEATSALDNATERAVMDAVYKLSAQKTIILIAHRLSTVRACDRIFVLGEGRVLEEGTWEELHADGEHFQRLAAHVS